MSVSTRAELEALRKQLQRRERALLRLVAQLARRERWLRARHGELVGRVRDLDSKQAAPAPAWPELVIPAEFAGQIADDDREG